MHKRKFLVVALALFATSAPALAGSHKWRFDEVFSNSAGNIQFIELWCDVSGENFVSNHSVTTPNGIFTFPENLTGLTADKRLLLATADFAALPGAPTPDYIIPNNFIPLTGGTLDHPPGNYDNWVYNPGDIPVNGTHSVEFQTNLGGNNVDTWIIAPNSPTNYQGGSGSVNAACLDADGDGFGDPGDANCSGGPQTDCDDSNPNIRPNAVENEGAGNCGDGSDNDCDGLVDCAEAGCANAIGACIPTVSEWGVVVLTLTMLCAGSVMLRGRL